MGIPRLQAWGGCQPSMSQSPNSSDQPPTKLLSLSEVSAYLGITPYFFCWLIHKGVLKRPVRKKRKNGRFLLPRKTAELYKSYLDKHVFPNEKNITVLNLSETARLLGCSTYNAIKLIKSGVFPNVTFGKSFFIPREDVETYIKNSKDPQFDRDSFYTLEETAHYLAKSISFVRNLIYSNALPGAVINTFLTGRPYFIPKKNVHDFKTKPKKPNKRSTSYTVKETAQLLGRTPIYILKLIKRGAFPNVYSDNTFPGKPYLIPKNDIENYKIEYDKILDIRSNTYTLKETACYLESSSLSVRKLIKLGTFPNVIINTSLRGQPYSIPKADVEAYQKNVVEYSRRQGLPCQPVEWKRL